MGAKKRGSSGIDEITKQPDASYDQGAPPPEHLRKKAKKEKTGNGTMAEGSSEQSRKPESIKPMERKKKRKALDKEKHRLSSDNNETTPRLMNLADDSSRVVLVNSPMPEFHISVFKDLASADAGVREAATATLVMELVEVQKAYDKLEKKEVVEGGVKLEAEKDDGLNNCAPSLRYAIRRLIRGVSSSRECARQGFSLGLASLIGAVPSIRVDSLLKLIIDLLEISSSMKGQEIRDCLLGRLFAYGSLSRSGRLVEESILGNNSEQIKEYISSLVSLASKKRYLQEPSVLIILDLVEKLPIEVVLSQVLEAPGLREWFEGAVEAGNPDALLLALKLQEKFSLDKDVFGKLLPHPCSSSSIFSVEHLSSLSNCFKESTFCQPRVHTLWPVLVNILLPNTVVQDVDSSLSSNSAKKHKKNRKPGSSDHNMEKNLRCFCDIIIDGSLLSSSHDRKHLALDIVLLLLPRIPTSCTSIVLSCKLVQCLMDVLSTKDSWLHKVAQDFLSKLLEWAAQDDSRRVAVIVSLQKHSSGRFDSITHMKTVKDLVAGFTSEPGCMLFVQNLVRLFLDESQASEEPSDQSQTTDDNSEIGSIEDKDSNGAVGISDFLKSWVVDSLPSILKHLVPTKSTQSAEAEMPSLSNEEKFRVQKEILKFLGVQGLFHSSLGTEVTSFELQEKFKWPKAATSSALCRMCIEQLQILLANAQKGERPHAVSGGLEANDLGLYFVGFFSTLRNIPSVALFRSLSNEDEVALKKLLSMETQLSREERNSGLSKDANRLHALRYLLIQLLLQLLLRPGEFFEAASELVICCKKLFPSSDLLDSSGEEESNGGDGMPEVMDVLVDTLLSLLPQSSASTRSAIEQVFKYFCEDITDDGLVRMLRVIKEDLKPSRRQDIAVEDDGEREDDDDLLGIEEEESDKAETGETGESEEHTDDSEARVAINEAVNVELPEASDDESDGGMDDDAMFRMDSYLAQIFREKKNQGGGETAHSQLVLFKLRVLSLLEIYLHENEGKPQVLKVFTSLSQAYISPQTAEGSEQLRQRIWGILQKKILKAKQCPRGESVGLSILEPLLEKNLKIASKPFKKKRSATVQPPKKKHSASFARHRTITSLAQNSTLWLLKIIDGRKFPEPELERVFEIFRGAMAGYFGSKRSQLKPQFLKEIFRRWPWIGRRFFGFLLEECGSAKSQFRQVEALELVTEILKGITPLAKDTLRSNLPKLSHLIKELVKKMPEKQSRRAEVRKFCGKVFGILYGLDLSPLFLETLEQGDRAACESQLGKPFLELLKKPREG